MGFRQKCVHTELELEVGFIKNLELEVRFIKNLELELGFIQNLELEVGLIQNYRIKKVLKSLKGSLILFRA